MYIPRPVILRIQYTVNIYGCIAFVEIGQSCFTSEINWEKNEVIFLDLVISIDKDGFLQTKLHTKPNAKNSLLLPSSCHPPSVTRGSVYGLALRVNRNCSTQEAADLRYKELAARLRQREYSEEVITAGIAKAKAVPRKEALNKVKKLQGSNSRQHRLVTEYDRRSSPAIASVLKVNYEQLVRRDQRLDLPGASKTRF